MQTRGKHEIALSRLDPVKDISGLTSVPSIDTRRAVKDALPVTTTRVAVGSVTLALLAGRSTEIVQPPNATATTTSKNFRSACSGTGRIDAMDLALGSHVQVQTWTPAWMELIVTVACVVVGITS
jgi:hypothetical protein